MSGRKRRLSDGVRGKDGAQGKEEKEKRMIESASSVGSEVAVKAASR